MMVHGICINGIKRKLLSSAMKMRKRSPLIPLGMQRKLLCANVFHDMEIRYVDIFASNRYAALKVPGNPGSRMLGRKLVQAGPPPADSGAPDSVFQN